MKAVLIRDIFQPERTFGIFTLYNDDNSIAFQCYTIEDTARALGVKIKGQTCIPEGSYLISLTDSQRFQRKMPLIYNQSNGSVQDSKGATWTGIRIHYGNTEVDSDGCVIVGESRNEIAVINSRVTFDRLFEILTKAILPIQFEIINKQNNF